MKRITVILFSLLIALLLAGLCSCKQEVTPETEIAEGAETATLNPGISGVDIPKWEKSKSGLQNLPDAVLSGSETGISAALKSALLNPSALNDAHFLIVMVCEGLSSDLIESSLSKYGEVLLNSFPVKGTTKSVFKSSSDQLLVDYVRDDQDKTVTGLMSYGDLASNSMRRMTTVLDNDASPEDVYKAEFVLGPPLKFFLGKGDFDALVNPDSPYHKNEVYKSHGKKAESFAEAVSLYKTVTTFEHGSDVEEGTVKKL
ncbi:MAG: hypothetical protein J5599_09740, partial [Spirochaetales bacterium]|nr:hypothetical protein [Spirochaetales bacterium]